MKVPYIIWSGDRQQKTIILTDDHANQLESVILKASAKLGIIGTKLVLDSNGTPLDDEALAYFNNQVILLLKDDEDWVPNQLSQTNVPNLEETGCLEINSNRSIPSGSTVTGTNIENTDSFIILTTSNYDHTDREVYFGDKENVEPNTFNSSNDIQISTPNCNSEEWWINFNVPWSKLTANQLELFKKGIPDSRTINNLIRITVDEMRTFKTFIPRSAFKLVVKKLIDKYPNIFLDKDRDGILIGDGTHKFTHKLVDRNNFLNRPFLNHKRAPVDNPIINKKQRLSARAGCSRDWSPEISTNSENLENQKNIRDSDENFYKILASLYSDMRVYLNKLPSPTVADIQQEWPIVFSKKSVEWHFEKLTTTNINLLDKINIDRDKLKDILYEKYKRENLPVIEKDTEKTYPLSIINIISLFFKEILEEIFIVFEKVEDINIDQILPSPMIIGCGDEDNRLFYVYFEKANVYLDGFKTFLEAFKYVMALFFILNLKYPKNLSATLEFLQRLYLKIHPDTGSKAGNKKTTATKQKVINLMLKLNKNK